MNKQIANLLEQHFDTAFAAPDGIKKLRELILTLAMQGKLVEQDPNDQPASDLLKDIERERVSLEGSKARRKGRELSPIKLYEIPYELPRGWEWVRLNDALDVRDGTHDTPKYVNVGYPLVTSKNIYTGALSLEDVKCISKEDHAKISERSKVDKGDILFAMIGSIGNPVIVDSDLEFSIKNVALFKFFLKGKPSNRYLHYYLILAQENMKAISSGAVQSFVSLGFLRHYQFPLPPLPEQHRIVARIDQLMARCDELEKLRNERDEKRQTVHAAAIMQLLDATDGSALDFIRQHFSELYSVKENVAELRKAILQLAVMGRLVPQNPNDPPASELLKEIEKEKASHECTKSRRKGEKLPEIFNEEMPHKIPSNWAWVRFGDIAQHNSGKTLDKGRNTGQPREYITTSNLYWGRFVLENVRQMLIREDELEKCTAKKDDLLICEGGEAGRAAVWPFDSEVCFQNHIHRARFYKDIDPYFAYRFFEKLNATGEINQYRKGVGISNMSGKVLASIVFPLPPQPEQYRIVARIDQLMALCDQLDQQIDAAVCKQTEILNAVMAQL